MRRFSVAALAALALLAACAPATTGQQAGPPGATPAAMAVPAPLTFPTAAEISASRKVEIAPGANLGAYGPMAQVTREPSCGFVRDGISTSPLAVPTDDGAGQVSLAFNVMPDRPCPRTATDRGVPYRIMTEAVLLANGLYTRGPGTECWLPNVGGGDCRQHKN